MRPTVAEQCGNMAIFKSGEVRSRRGFAVLVDLKTFGAVGCEASRAWVIRHLSDLPSLSLSLKSKVEG